MAETITQTFNSLNTNSKRMYKKQNIVYTDIPLTYSSKDPVSSSTTISNDWHRLLLARLKPGVTRKYQTTRKDGNKFNTHLSTSFEDLNVTLQSYTDDSQIIDDHQINLTQTDAPEEYNSFIEHSIRRVNHYVKNFIPYRFGDHITSLKRRVRKQQMKHFQKEVTILQETTFRPQSSTDLFLMSYSEQGLSPRRYKQKKSSCVVPLPPLTNTTRGLSTPVHDVKLNRCEY